MANSWKKIIDKVDSIPVSGPQASDWEAMNAKIAESPSLSNPKGRGGFWWKTGLGVFLLGVLGLGYLMYSSNSEVQVDSEEGITPTERSVTQSTRPSETVATTNNVVENLVSMKNQVEPKEVTNTQTQVETNHSDEEVIFSTESSVAENEVSNNSEGDNIVVNESSIEEVTESMPVVLAAAVTHQAAVPETEREEETSRIPDSEFEPSLEEPELVVSEEVFTNQEQPIESELPIVLVAVESDEELAFEEESTEGLAEESSEEFEEDEEVTQENIPSVAQSDEPESTAPADPVNLRSAGFSLNGLNVGGGYSTDFSGDLYGAGLGIDVDIQRGGLLLNTGIHYYQMSKRSLYISSSTDLKIDTLISYRRDTTITVEVDSAWVITGPNQGGLQEVRRDTVILVDSVANVSIDSVITTNESSETKRVKLSYIEMPIMVGHRFRFNRFAVDIYGGVILNQLTTGTVEGKDIEKKFGMDAVLQPAIRYYIKPQWSVFGRAGLRYGLVANDYRPQKLYSNFQIGLTYHW